MSTAELACVYSAILLSDDNIAISVDKIQTILKAANIEIEPYWAGMFAKYFESIDVKQMLKGFSAGAGSGPAVGGAAPAAAAAAGDVAAKDDSAAAKKDEKKVEESEESDDDMGFGLFD